MRLQLAYFAVRIETISLQKGEMSCLSPTTLLDHNEQTDYPQRIFNCQNYLLLLCPIWPLHKLYKFLSVLPAAQYGRDLGHFQCSSLLQLHTRLSHKFKTTSLSMIQTFSSKHYCPYVSRRSRHSHHHPLCFSATNSVFFCRCLLPTALLLKFPNISNLLLSPIRRTSSICVCVIFPDVPSTIFALQYTA